MKDETPSSISINLTSAPVAGILGNEEELKAKLAKRKREAANLERAEFEKRRMRKTWIVFITSGAFGWYEALVAAEILPRWLYGWTSLSLSLLAIAGGVGTIDRIGHEVERMARLLMEDWWQSFHYARRREKQERLLKCFFVAILLWMAPLIFAVFGSIV